MASKLWLKIWGQVQGVGLRMSVKEYAGWHDLRGWVQNLDDGSVVIEIYGDKVKLDSFLQWLTSNFRITRIESKWEKANSLPDDFNIRY